MLLSQINTDLLKSRTYLEVDTDSSHLLLLADLESMIQRKMSPQMISRKYNNYIDELTEEELLVFAVDVEKYLDERGAFSRHRSPRS